MWKKPDPPPPLWRYVFFPPTSDAYTYFEGLPPDDEIDEYHRAGRMADAAMLAYGRYGPSRMTTADVFSKLFDAGLHDAELIGNWGSGGGATDGYCAGNAFYGLVVFRGTERSDWVDFLQDLTAIPVPAVPEGSFGSLVHVGFALAANEAWPRVRTWVERYRLQNPTAPVYFVGHSLGGAVASIIAGRFAGNWRRLYTFGCPRVGNAVYCARLRTLCLTDRALRFVNSTDLVPHLPPESILYRHPGPGGVRFIRSDGTITETAPRSLGFLEVIGTARAGIEAMIRGVGYDDIAPDSLANHGIVRYCYRIWNWASRGKAFAVGA